MQVKVYGVLTKYDQDQSRTKVTIDDYTGQTTANLKQKSYTSEYYQSSDIIEGVWVSAFIQVRPFKDKMLYSCVSMQKVESFDEVTLHIAQVCLMKKQ